MSDFDSLDDDFYAQFGFAPQQEVAADRYIPAHSGSEALTLNYDLLEEVQDVATQELMFIVELLTLEQLQILRYCNHDAGQLCDSNFQKSIGIAEPCAMLFDRSVKAVKKCCNTLCQTFLADSEGGAVQEGRNGAYVYDIVTDSESGKQERRRVMRNPGPNIGWVPVNPKDVFNARLVSSALKQKYHSTYNKAGKVVSQTSCLIKANVEGAVPTKDRILVAIGAALIRPVNGGKGLVWAWDAVAQLHLKTPVGDRQTTGLCLLYYAYRSLNTGWKSVTDNVKDFSFAATIEKLSSVEIDRGQIQGLLDNCVWRGGSPVPPSQIIASFLEDYLPGMALRGTFASDVATWVKDRTIYCSSVSLPDPLAGVTIVVTDPRHVLAGDTGVFWGPNPKIMGSLVCEAIAVPISAPVASTNLALSWMRKGTRYSIGVTYGANPVLWVWKSDKGVTIDIAGDLLRRLAFSALWIPIYNLTQCYLGKWDIWGVIYDKDGFEVSRCDSLRLYKYCPIQNSATPIVPPLKWDDNTFDFSVRDPSADDYVPGSPAYEPPAKRHSGEDKMEDANATPAGEDANMVD